MKLRTWNYYIRQGFSGIAKNGLMSLASIVTVAACSFIVILSLCIAMNISFMLDQVESKVGVILFMGDKPTDADVDELKAQIEKMPHVTGVKFKSDDEALEEYGKQTNQNFDSLKNDNPLPRSLEISIDDIKNQDAFVKSMEELQVSFEKKLFGISEDGETGGEASTQATSVEQTSQVQTVKEQPTQAATQAKVNAPATQPATQATAPTTQAQATQATTLPVKNEAEQPKAISPNMPEIVSEATTAITLTAGPVIGDADYQYQGIETIKHSQRITDVLLTVDTVFKIVSIILIAILCLISIGIIMNTIKLTVFIRKNEINIMKYVGATDWFIRWPFIIEGIVIGIIGATIPTVLCWLGYMKVYTAFNSSNILSGFGKLLECNQLFTLITPIVIGVGVLLGAIGSINSIRKHLNV